MKHPRDVDPVFKALADPTRRLLLDRLREQDGRTLGELCDQVAMARQSVTQHLDQLVRADLVSVVRRGRERLHYLNPAPIHDLEARWISAFDRPRLDALRAVADRAEELAMTTTTTTVPTYVYVTYIRAGAAQVWQALTDADVTARYWNHANVSDWQPGSSWEHRQVGDSDVVDIVGRVVASEPPHRLVITFEDPAHDGTRDPSVVTFLIEPHEDLVRLTVTHENLPNPEMLHGISRGWPAVLANLKSLLGTGEVLPAVFEMP